MCPPFALIPPAEDDPKATFACEAGPVSPCTLSVDLHPEHRCRGFLSEYDDGNGLWITSGETPCDLGFLRCASPQEYHHTQGLSAKREGSEPGGDG